MNRLKLLSVTILFCLNIATATICAQSRPLRTTEHAESAAKTQAATEQANAEVVRARLDATQARAQVAAAQAQVAAAQARVQAADALAASRPAAEGLAEPAASAATAQTLTERADAIQTLALAMQVQAATEKTLDAAEQTLAAKQATAAGQSAAAASQGKDCWFVPASHCYSDKNDAKMKSKEINDFYSMAQSHSFISQVKSIYNGASQSATISADLASLNFPLGFQFIFGTNVQAGVTSPTTVTTGSTATLTPTSAAQATQNMIYGGTFNTAFLFPLIYHGLKDADTQGGMIFSMDAIAKGGVDIQNFKAGTSTTVDNPPTHANLGLESFLQLNSTSVNEATNSILGNVFVGGQYGYNYASHEYARDYGFGNRVSSGVGQVVIGAVLSGIARVSISRGFGPSQVYVDSTSTSTLPKRINNFKSWSFGLTYQTPPSSAKTP